MKNRNKTEKINIIKNSKSVNKNLIFIQKNKDLKEFLQELNNINDNIIKYEQLERLLKFNIHGRALKEIDKKENNNNDAVLEDMKLIQNRLYKSKIVPKKSYDNNNNFYKNHVKEVIKSMFRSSDIKRKYYPKQKGNLKQLYNLNTYFSEKTLEKNNKNDKNKDICLTDRNINNELKNKKNNSIENEKNKSINYEDYASKCVEYKHPQFYLLNSKSMTKRKLPPLKMNRVKTIDLINNDNSDYFRNLKKRRKFDKFILAMKLGAFSKFKVNQ